MDNTALIQPLTNPDLVPVDQFGARAHLLAKLKAADLPVPPAFGVSSVVVAQASKGVIPDLIPTLRGIKPKGLISVRCSPVDRAWGGPETLLNVGMTPTAHGIVAKRVGLQAADALYCRFVQDFAVLVARLDPEDFDDLRDAYLGKTPDYAGLLKASLHLYEDEMEVAFPIRTSEQLEQAIRSMANAWEGTTARLLRQARGAPADAGLGIVLQRMALGMGHGECGAGVAQFVDPVSGEAKVFGRYQSQAQGRDALRGGQDAKYLSIDPRGMALEEASPEAYASLQDISNNVRKACCDEMQLDFTIEDGRVWLLDATVAERSGRAAVAIAVNLAEAGVISNGQALLSVPPKSLTEMLHPQVNTRAKVNVLATGIAASPGAATGRIVFSAAAAQASASQEVPSILVRPETTPEDIRGMHSAQGILTERGGINSHAAVIARGLGLPCVVGVTDITIDTKTREVRLDSGVTFNEGDWITLDGTDGRILTGQVDLVQPELGDDFKTFLSWADDVRDIKVRANADTPFEAHLSRKFKVDGIGLCRTEHMFFEIGRLTLMRELILSEREVDRRAALEKLLPMQRSDFVELFEIMEGLPVCIRLLDPPLHEFLPKSRIEMQAVAEAMDVPVSQVASRVDEMREFNPMLGLRGVRLGITVPDIYDMQARAIFEAATELQQKGFKIVPEIMVPLVSANAEVDMVKARVETIASNVRAETGIEVFYKLGVMVETPRAALRAGDLAKTASFLSFGTNDLTQMAYGLSRDDAGRFMREYVNSGVYPEDPFLILDVEGVGELMLIASERARSANSDLELGLCGEHGGDPSSIAFCQNAGFDYVSCSPFRTPIARLAAAQHVIKSAKNG